jgi:hypothetical protein
MLFTSACLCAAGCAGAAEWSASPVLGWTLDHDSNRQLSPDGRSGDGGFVQLDLTLLRDTGVSTLSLRPHIDLQRYSSDTARDADNRSLQAAGTWRSTRSTLSAQASYAQENTLNQEFTGTGVVGVDLQRLSKQAAFSWTYEQAKDRDHLDVQLSYSDIAYQGDFIYRFSGYRYPYLSVTQTLGLSSRSSLQLTAYGSQVSTPENPFDSDSNSVGAQIGFSHDLTSRISTLVSGGYSRQTFGDSSESGYIGRVEVSRTDVRGKWRLFAQRNVTPGAFGTLVTQNEAGIQFDRYFAPRWSGGFAVAMLTNDDLAQAPSNEVHRYNHADGWLRWEATRTWTINLGASVRRAQQVQEAPFAEGWRALFTASWAPRLRRLSR